MARSIAGTMLRPGAGRRSAADDESAEPPVALPPGRLVHLRGRGELLVRDTGETHRPVVLLLHGWMFSADLNWFTTYAPLQEAGFRVIALDHRGHGRGIRSPEPFRLQDCADDAAELLRALDTPPAIVVGYSLGGAVAQLMARDHADVVSGIVLCATANSWSEPKLRVLWSGMALLRVALGLAPEGIWRRAMRVLGQEGGAAPTWHAAELSRGSAVALAEAGRELGRFDSAPWNGRLDVPAAVVVTTDDTSVAPAKQHALARSLGAPVEETPGPHGAVTMRADTFNPALLRALASVSAAAAGERLVAA